MFLELPLARLSCEITEDIANRFVVRFRTPRLMAP